MRKCAGPAHFNPSYLPDLALAGNLGVQVGIYIYTYITSSTIFFMGRICRLKNSRPAKGKSCILWILAMFCHWRENLPNQNITSIRLDCLDLYVLLREKKHTVLSMHYYYYYYYHHHPYYKYYYFYILLNLETTLCFLKIDKTVT